MMSGECSLVVNINSAILLVRESAFKKMHFKFWGTSLFASGFRHLLDFRLLPFRLWLFFVSVCGTSVLSASMGDLGFWSRSLGLYRFSLLLAGPFLLFSAFPPESCRMLWRLIWCGHLHPSVCECCPLLPVVFRGCPALPWLVWVGYSGHLRAVCIFPVVQFS